MAAWLFLALLGHSARAELTPAVKGSSLQWTVGQRLCYAGRFRFERALREGQQYLGRCAEQVPSSKGHPNAQKLDEVHVVLLGNEVFKPELGKTFCLTLTAGSKQGFTVEAFGPDDAATRKELEEALLPCRSANCHANVCLFRTVPQGGSR